MKITLHNPPDGFEAEAEYREVRKGEWMINCDGVAMVCGTRQTVYNHIVLTPKKRKYWRLDTVATKEDATKDINKRSMAFFHSRKYPEFCSGTIDYVEYQWLKLTEFEE